MKLRKALFIMSVATGVLLLNPSAVFATGIDTEYTEDGSNDELTGSEIDSLDTVEDEHDVNDYGKPKTRSDGDTNPGLTENGTTEDGSTTTTPTEDEDTGYDPWNDDSSTEDTEDTEDTEVDVEATKKKVKTPKTADSMPVYILGLVSALAAAGYAIFRKER